MNQYVAEITEQNFQAQIEHSESPILVEFNADWCGPCKMLAPIVDEIAAKYNGVLRVGSLDSDMNPAITERYEVWGLPTMLLFHKGQLMHRIVGFKPRQKIEAELAQFVQLQTT
jgi:thioredoxin 1